MIHAQPSRTAQTVATHRAAHQLLDLPPVLADPLALAMAGSEAAAVLQGDPRSYDPSPVAPFMRAFMAARSRFTEDQLAHCRTRGVQQYVVLGAGLDTSAYRVLGDEGPPLRVWEVDHPATQAWKRQRLQEAGIPLPDALSFVPLDFESRTLPAALADAGFDAQAGAVFSWLGVVLYLSWPTIRTTLSYVAQATRAGGGVAFDYLQAPHLLGPIERSVFDRMAARVAEVGEPWHSTFEPQQLTADLLGLGFAAAQDISPDELNARYFAGRTDGLLVGNMGRMMWAGAGPAAARV